MEFKMPKTNVILLLSVIYCSNRTLMWGNANGRYQTPRCLKEGSEHKSDTTLHANETFILDQQLNKIVLENADSVFKMFEYIKELYALQIPDAKIIIQILERYNNEFACMSSYVNVVKRATSNFYARKQQEEIYASSKSEESLMALSLAEENVIKYSNLLIKFFNSLEVLHIDFTSAKDFSALENEDLRIISSQIDCVLYNFLLGLYMDISDLENVLKHLFPLTSAMSSYDRLFTELQND